MTASNYLDIIKKNIPELFAWIIANNPDAVFDNVVNSGLGVNPSTEADLTNILNQLYQQNKVDDIVRIINVPYIFGALEDPNMDIMFNLLKSQAEAAGKQVDIFKNMEPNSILAYVVPGVGSSIDEIFSGSNKKPVAPDVEHRYNRQPERIEVTPTIHVKVSNKPLILTGLGLGGLIVVLMIIQIFK
jgi:hypothetical protein